VKSRQKIRNILLKFPEADPESDMISYCNGIKAENAGWQIAGEFLRIHRLSRKLTNSSMRRYALGKE
jgi:hypothetical protein